MRKSCRLMETPSQTAGPYVHIGCVPNFSDLRDVYPNDLGASMVSGSTDGEKIEIRGAVYDGAGAPVLDALVEVWQANEKGVYPNQVVSHLSESQCFNGWGRFAGDMETGEFRLKTIRPGKVQFDDTRFMNPHITFWIVARGINLALQTRMYFPEDDPNNDPILTTIDNKDRQNTLIASKVSEGVYNFDIRLQGENETIFFDF